MQPAKKTTMETFPYQSTVDMSVIPPSLVHHTPLNVTHEMYLWFFKV